MMYKDLDMGAHYFYFLMKQNNFEINNYETHTDIVMEFSFLIGRTVR